MELPDSVEERGGPGAEVPKLQPIRKPLNVTAISVAGLFLLATFYTFYFARSFLLPVTMAWMLSMLLKPIVRYLKVLDIPEAIGAAILMVGLICVVSVTVILLSEPASNWLRRAPESMARVEQKVRNLTSSANDLSKAAQSVEHLANRGEDVPKVELKKPGLLDNVLTRTKHVLVMGVEVFALLYFFLAAGDVFTLKLIQVLPRLEDKKRAVEIVRKTQTGISQYLLSITIINIIEGTAIGAGLALIGMPNPLLWGVLAFAANYIPYLGALAAGSVVTLVAFVSFESTSHALLAPLVYFGVNFMDNFLAPYIMGRRLVLNPVVVFLAVMFWGWLWGIAGVLLAVPITMTIKIICDHNAVLAPFAEFLAGVKDDKEEPQVAGELKPTLAKGNA